MGRSFRDSLNSTAAGALASLVSIGAATVAEVNSGDDLAAAKEFLSSVRGN